MRIGELAAQIGVSADTVRFYERAGWLPRPARGANDYREYTTADADHLRLLIDLRRLDISLEEAARVASWCHSGHCTETVAQLPILIATQRAEISERVERLRELDTRLEQLERHLQREKRTLTMLAGVGSPCCDAATAVVESAEGDARCACCAVAAN